MIGQIVVALFFVLFVLWIRRRQKTIKIFQKLGIPGPKPNVIFGNMWEIYKKGPLKCQEEWIQTYGTIYGFYFGMRPLLVVAEPELIKKILIKDFSLFCNRPTALLTIHESKDTELLRHLASQRDENWKETRGLLTPAFTANKLKQMDQDMCNTVDVAVELVSEKAATGKEFDICQIWKKLTADVIGRMAFGIETGVQRNQEHVLMKSSRILLDNDLQTPFFITSFSFKEFGLFFVLVHFIMLLIKNKMENPFKAIKIGLQEIIQERRNSKVKRADLLQFLIDAEITDSVKNLSLDKLTAVEKESNQEEQDTIGCVMETTRINRKRQFLSDDAVRANAALMYFAGYETTSNALGFLTHYIVKHQDVQETLRNEILQLYENEGEISGTSVSRLPYLECVVKEALRLHPAAYMFVNREVSKDVTIGTYLVPKGMAVHIPIYSIHRNPKYWEEPNEFKPTRFLEDSDANTNLKWLAFGAGPRNCIGLRFALMEMKLCIAKMLLKYRLQPSEKTKDEIKFCIQPAVLLPVELYLKAVPLKKTK